MTDRFSRDDVQQLARLCRVDLSDEEIEAFRDQLKVVVAWLEELRGDPDRAAGTTAAEGPRGAGPRKPIGSRTDERVFPTAPGEANTRAAEVPASRARRPVLPDVTVHRPGGLQKARRTGDDGDC